MTSGILQPAVPGGIREVRQIAKVGLNSLRIIDVLTNISDLEDEKNSSEFFGNHSLIKGCFMLHRLQVRLETMQDRKQGLSGDAP
jgi:hypothetical protein